MVGFFLLAHSTWYTKHTISTEWLAKSNVATFIIEFGARMITLFIHYESEDCRTH